MLMKLRESWGFNSDHKEIASVIRRVLALMPKRRIGSLQCLRHVNFVRIAAVGMAGYSIIALFPIGYPSADSAPLNLHDISKPKDEMLAVV